jgi:hypothetical protein
MTSETQKEIPLLTCEICGEQWGSVTKCERLDKKHCGFCCPNYRARYGDVYREHLKGANTSSEEKR